MSFKVTVHEHRNGVKILPKQVGSPSKMGSFASSFVNLTESVTKLIDECYSTDVVPDLDMDEATVAAISEALQVMTAAKSQLYGNLKALKLTLSSVNENNGKVIGMLTDVIKELVDSSEESEEHQEPSGLDIDSRSFDGRKQSSIGDTVDDLYRGEPLPESPESSTSTSTNPSELEA